VTTVAAPDTGTRTAVFYVERPLSGKCRAFVPRWLGITLNDVREVCGATTRPRIRPYWGETDEAASTRPDGRPVLDEIIFSRQYSQAFCTWLRQRGEVQLRTVHVEGAHCSPQCEGAWKHEEAGQEHSESCTCRCGGYRHDTARPWFARHQMIREFSEGRLVSRVWKLAPLEEAGTGPPREPG
jgi:hypothetical protein